MEKTIKIDGKDVKFKATAGTPRRYLALFHRDLLKDMNKMYQESQGDGMSAEGLEVFLNIAYVMAKQADDTIPNNPDEWLDEFSMFSIYEILPQIMELWGVQAITTVEEKKRPAKRRAK